MGVTLRRRGCPHNRKPIPLPLEEIRNALEGGSNYALEARKYGVSERTIRNRFKVKI
jgi:hypothetical protein